MKTKLFRLIAMFATMVMAIFVTSCSNSDDNESFDKALMTGKWQSGTEYYYFASDGNGYTWESSEVTEEDAQDFTWSLAGSILTINHKMGISSAQITKIYTMLTLSSTTLKFKDDYKTFSYTKVQ